LSKKKFAKLQKQVFRFNINYFLYPNLLSWFFFLIGNYSDPRRLMYKQMLQRFYCEF